MGIDIGKNSFHVVGLDERGIVVRQLAMGGATARSRVDGLPGPQAVGGRGF
jgi:hypothetical protein